jgi:hypothetical protein
VDLAKRDGGVVAHVLPVLVPLEVHLEDHRQYLLVALRIRLHGHAPRLGRLSCRQGHKQQALQPGSGWGRRSGVQDAWSRGEASIGAAAKGSFQLLSMFFVRPIIHLQQAMVSKVTSSSRRQRGRVMVQQQLYVHEFAMNISDHGGCSGARAIVNMAPTLPIMTCRRESLGSLADAMYSTAAAIIFVHHTHLLGALLQIGHVDVSMCINICDI